MDDYDLSDHEKEVLRAVVEQSIKKVDYKNPRSDLGVSLTNENLPQVMRRLEDIGIVRFRSSGFLFFKKNFYEIQGKAKEAYDSLDLGK